jgi:hypothetical protein
MRIYIVYIFTAILSSWVIAFYLGFSSGFASYLPILALLGTIILFVIAAPILMYYRQSGLIIGLISSLSILPYSIMFLKGILEDGVLNWGILLALPTLLTIISICLTGMALLGKATIAIIPSNPIAKLVLAGSPIGLFILYILFYGRYWDWGMFKI